MNTKTFLTLTALAVATAGLTACGGNEDANDPAVAPPVADVATDPGMETDPMATDGMDQPGMDADAAGGAQGEALALVMAVDQHEIAAAEQARDKDLPADVAEYAEMLHTEHSQNLEADRQLAQDSGISPATTDKVTAQKEKGEAELDRLADLEGEAYADAYVDAMVTGHTEALAMIDDQLLPAATDPALQAHLTATRGHIANHLERGEALQAE